jgi:hypothetical protein
VATREEEGAVSDTPRTDATQFDILNTETGKTEWYVEADFARGLEREIARLTGITLRDYFAGQVIAACWEASRHENGFGQRTYHDHAAEVAYKTADAMMRARVKP